MGKSLRSLLVPSLAAALVLGVLIAREHEAAGQKQDAGASGGKADRDAIEKAGRDFMHACEKGDYGALAELWTEQGELHLPDGGMIHSRANIQKAFVEFFKENPKVKIEVLVESIRFPAANVAVEEGVLRRVSAGRELPSTTLYHTTHVREGGQWKIAVSREWGAGQDRLEDLADRRLGLLALAHQFDDARAFDDDAALGAIRQ